MTRIVFSNLAGNTIIVYPQITTVIHIAWTLNFVAGIDNFEKDYLRGENILIISEILTVKTNDLLRNYAFA